MGLDMFLIAKRDFCETDDQPRQRAVLMALGLDGFNCDGLPSLTVELGVAYWHSDYQISAWFRQFVSPAEDGFRQEVTRDDLGRLIRACHTVLDSYKIVAGKVIGNPEVARSLLYLPAGEVVDRPYLQEVQDALALLETLLSDQRFFGWDFEYRESW